MSKPPSGGNGGLVITVVANLQDTPRVRRRRARRSPLGRGRHGLCHEPSHDQRRSRLLNQAKTVSVSAYSPHRVAYFLGLEPDTTYAISVRATDLQGRRSVRSGTFKTLPIKTTPGIGGPGTIDSGLGCSQQCITKALVSQNQPDGTTARLDIRTSTTAHIQIDVSRDKPVQLAGGGLAQYDVVSRQWTPSPTKDWTPIVAGLDYGTKYYVVGRARDDKGRVSFRQG